jgi:hypothetical protein
MTRLWIVILTGSLLFSACGDSTITNTPTGFSQTVIPTVKSETNIVATGTTYYVDGNLGSDSNPGTKDQPWQTIQNAVKRVIAGDTVYIRGGQYLGIQNGWFFQNSGSPTKPITLTNYPGEQVVFKHTTVTNIDYPIFSCSINPNDLPSWQTPKADYIRIIGTDVIPQLLSNKVESKKGIVFQGLEGEQSYDISVADCDHWEVAGIDFIETAGGIRTWKNNFQMEEHSTDNWNVHDNRVYIFYRESGMQFNGDENIIVNNEIYKVTNRMDTPYGCQLLNILGDHNIIRGNTLSRAGSATDCAGILFEWDLADANLVERNLIIDLIAGIDIEGGDNNLIRNNIIYRIDSPNQYRAGIEIKSYDSLKTDWPCNETSGTARALLPANNPANPDYQYYYNPRNCHSYGNQIYNNTIHGFVEGIRLYPLAGENTIIRNNTFSNWTRGDICLYNTLGFCNPLPVEVTVSNNAAQHFNFVDILRFDFHLKVYSPLIDAGYDLGSLNPNDFDGNSRPQDHGFDIGAYEFLAP